MKPLLIINYEFYNSANALGFFIKFRSKINL